MGNEIAAMTPILAWFSEMLSLFQAQSITIPGTYRDQVIAVKKLLDDDPSGLTNTLLDFSIECALTTYRIEVESDSDGLEILLNNWLSRTNLELLGKVPTGLEPLAREYFRERWKGSSNLLLRTFWNNVDGLVLPTHMFFVEGADIKIKGKDKNEAIKLGDEKYLLNVNGQPKDDIPLPKEKNEEIFIQRPYENWGTLIPTPFLIKRGVYRQSKFIEQLSNKGENIITKALEYLFILKKGTEKMFLEGQVTYDKQDLDKVKDDLRDLISKKTTEPGFSTMAANFDTEISEYIPDYKKVISEELYAPKQRQILAGLGFIDVVEGIGSSRRESILNPKPFIGEVNRGISDFKILLGDIIKMIIVKNKNAHPKWMNSKISINSSPISHFIDDKFRTMLRSAFDRGVVSKRTLAEIGLELDFDLEVERRAKEKAEGLEKKMYPPVIQNQEQHLKEEDFPGKAPQKKKDTKDDVPPDKKGLEKKNFNLSSWEEAKVDEKLPKFGMTCLKCEYEGDLIEFLDNLIESETHNQTVSICPGCGEELLEEDVTFASHYIPEQKKKEKNEKASIVFEQAPYKTNKDLPTNLKKLPAGAKTIWRKSFNAILKQSGDENLARQGAWRNVKLSYKKVGDNWIKKEKAEISSDLQDLNIEDVIEIKKLKMLGKQETLLDKILKAQEEQQKETDTEEEKNA